MKPVTQSSHSFEKVSGKSQLYFVEVNQIQTGPYSQSEIFKKWSLGEFSPRNLIWRKGFDNWVELKDCPDFFTDLPPENLPENKVEKLYEKPSLPPIPSEEEYSAGFQESSVLSPGHSEFLVKEDSKKKRPISPFKKAFYASAFALTGVLVLFVWLNSKIKIPDGLKEDQFQILSSILKTNPYKKNLMKGIFDPKSGSLWLSSNIEGISFKLILKAIPEKSLTLSPIVAETHGKFIGHFSHLKSFAFIEGAQFYPGFYQLIVEYSFEKKQQIFKDLIFIGEAGLSENAFSESLAIYNSKVRNIFKNYKKELDLNYQTLMSVSQILEEDFVKASQKITRGREIISFQKSYIEKAGPFLTQFTLKNFERPEEIKIDLSKIVQEYRSVFTISKSLAGLSSEIIQEIRGLKKISKFERMKLRAKYLKKFGQINNQIRLNYQSLKDLKPFF